MKTSPFSPDPDALDKLLTRVRSCRHCEAYLPLGPNPIVRLSPKLELLLISQAPGTAAHKSSTPYRDPSGQRLRQWLGVTEAEFYETGAFGILPMAFCYPGRGQGGDLAPRPECAPLWHEDLLRLSPKPKLTLLIGQYAQAAYLGKFREPSLTQTVRSFEDYLPDYWPLPHPSPRNNIWMAKNPWFEEVVFRLQSRVHDILVEAGFR